MKNIGSDSVVDDLSTRTAIVLVRINRQNPDTDEDDGDEKIMLGYRSDGDREREGLGSARLG